MRHTLVQTVCLVLLCLLPRVASAQGPSRDSVAQAESVFRSAKDADARGDLATACAEFAESQRLDPAVGTLLNLADCEARSGDTSAAREHYEAARAQMTPGDARHRFASDQIAALSPSPPGSSAPTRDAVSAPPSQDNRFAVAAMIGYSSDDMSFGLGLRAGKVVFSHVYLGATFVYQLGDSTSTGVAAGGVQASATSSVSGYYVGPEAGYDFEIRLGTSSLVLRPYAGIGLYGYTTSVSATSPNPEGLGTTEATSASSTKNGLAVWPGAAAFYGLPGSAFFLMADARAITVPGGPAFGMFAGAGMRL